MRFLFGPDRQLPPRLPDAARNEQALAFTAEQLWRASSWESFALALDLEGMPDFLVFDLPYRVLPSWLWSAPLPLVALAGDAPLQWHSYRRLDGFDLLLADAPSVERFHRQGLHHARPANLYGVEQVFLDEGGTAGVRDIDVLFVGNLNPHLQGERLPWLQRLARLRPRFNVQILTDAWGADYRALQRRSRIVFNRSARSEWNRRVSETLAAGALALIERGNAEVTGILEDRIECVFYDERDLESLLEHYLNHEEDLLAIAR